MPLFLLLFFLLYGSFHLYAFLRCRKALPFSKPAAVILVIFMLFMIASPILVRFAEASDLEGFARFLAYLGYFWMGLLFVFVCSCLMLDGYHVVITGLARVLPSLIRYRPGRKAAFYLPLFFSLFVTLYGYLDAQQIRIETLVIKTEKIPPGSELRIAQISDVHLGLIVREQRLTQILAAVKATRPDILVSTGDLVDGQSSSFNGLMDLFRQIDARDGKYAVTGNHEYYAGIEQSLRFTKNAGFTILRGEGKNVSDLINIAGVDDRTGQRFESVPEVNEAEMLNSLPRDTFTLLLKHQPIMNPESLGLFDLQLSGHTHKGQIFPFNLVTWLYFPVHTGVMPPVNGSYLYVNRGSGTWGPPFRFLSSPEVTLIRLVHDRDT